MGISNRDGHLHISHIGHSKSFHHRRESRAMGHSFTIFNTVSVRTPQSRGRRNRIMTPGGVYSPEDWLHLRSEHGCLLCACRDYGGANVWGDRRLQISTDRPTRRRGCMGALPSTRALCFGSQVAHDFAYSTLLTSGRQHYITQFCRKNTFLFLICRYHRSIKKKKEDI